MTTSSRTFLRIDSRDAFERGRQRGEALRDSLRLGIEGYLALFDAVGVDLAEVRENAEQALAATEAWWKPLVTEMRGTAAAADVPLWQVAALNARTEILSGAGGTRPGECSTIVSTTSHPVGAQTWDWHEELADYWHVQEVRGNDRSFVGMTEHGILGKIGINDAGVGIMLNILGHRDDRPGSVPVHLVCARLLAQASSLVDAIDILRSAPMSTSSAITVLSPEGAAVVELSPWGAAVLTPVNDLLLHTNHFLDQDLAQGERQGIYDPDSQFRYATLAERVDEEPLPTVATGLIPYLASRPGDQGQLCCTPAAGSTLGDRWATLATISLDAAARAMTISAGSPLDPEADNPMRLVAAV